MRKVIVEADTKKQAFNLARKKRFLDGKVTTKAVPVSARPVAHRPGKYEVTVRKSRR